MTGGHLLSNGRYRVLVTAAGAGYSSLSDILLTRWTADPTREGEGWFLYLKDLETGRYWSAGHQPVQRPADAYQARSSTGLVMLAREDEDIALVTEIAVDSTRDIEWRRHTITNRSQQARRLELTTCIEVALDLPAAAVSHPAFSKLFIQTEYLPGHRALLARRRPRSPDEPVLVLGHALLGDGALEWETDRARFIGRGGSLRNPRALEQGAMLSGTTGNVLDPVLSLRCELALEPGASVRVETVLAVGTDRDAVERLLVSAATGASDAVFPLDRRLGALVELAAPIPRRFHPARGIDAASAASKPLAFFNGLGGFSADGNEYVIRLDRTPGGLRLPPLPWCNVIANESAGFIASERGLGFTWCENSRENRLTTWFNDPVADPAAECLHIRDEDAGLFWSPTPGPTPGSGAYEVRHGFGYTRWRHSSAELEQDVMAFVPVKEPVKVIRLRVRNRSLTVRRLSVFYFAEWVLGGARAETVTGIVTESAKGGSLLLARHPGSVDFGDRVAFAAASGPAEGGLHFTADREAYLGRFGSTEAPEALGSIERLDGRTGTGFDPCAALQLRAELAPGATGEWTFLLGQVEDEAAAATLAARFGSPELVDAALAGVQSFWMTLLSAVKVETPQPAMDLMVNGWLSYQNLSCRMWARSAFYQSGGAFGYRDQLQDAAALVYHRPDLTRTQIVLHAGRQFVEGDVLHWWHPPAGRGIRTRFSDDLLWLPFVTEFYVATTGDASVLDESAGFLAAPPLPEDEDELFLEPADAGTAASVYEHCCRAIDRSLTRGRHGLPLMGTGDWNDGMNRVGRRGRGESVWLGFFLFGILGKFVPICRKRQDRARVSRYSEYQAALGIALNEGGWDGGWYRRAYYDDGTPLGSSQNEECRIDAIAQAWSVLSGAAPRERAELALDAMERYLVDEPARLIRLLTPPFDRTPHDPGYIKGYLPGVRENGGQYTHAALWAVRALVEAGRGDRAAPLFELLNPVRHGDSARGIEVYQGEPYVVAADVYGTAPHLGRAGWTWYTGSAGWMFRVALESILGVTIRDGNTLVLCPCIPPDWPGFSVQYRLPDGSTRYHIIVTRTEGATTARGEGLRLHVEDGSVLVELRSDGRTHRVHVDLGPDAGPRYRPAPSTSP
jgi:cyclic beta-1,2-glucan synthetase